jgi:hypothetical protein
MRSMPHLLAGSTTMHGDSTVIWWREQIGMLGRLIGGFPLLQAFPIAFSSSPDSLSS